MIVKITDGGIVYSRELAALREADIVYRPTELTPKRHLIGAFGEVGLAEPARLPWPVFKPGGDNGIDFEVDGITIDVKATVGGMALLVKKDFVLADIYVYARVISTLDGVVDLRGWVKREAVLSVPPRDTGRGIVNHQVHENDRRFNTNIEDFIARIAARAAA
jgi:hypothetical protein